MYLKKNLHEIISNTLIIFAIIPICIFSVYMSYTNANTYKSDVEKRLESRLSSVSLVLDNFDKNNKDIIKIFCVHPYIQKSLKTNIYKENLMGTIEEFTKTYDEIKSIYIGLDNGTMYSKNEKSLPKHYDPRKRPWYIETLKSDDKIVVSHAYESIDKKGIYDVTYSKKIVDSKSGELLGIVGLDINLDLIKKYTLDTNLNKSEFLIILNQYSQIIADNNPKMKENIQNDNSIIKKILSENKMNSQISIDGKKYIYYLKKNNSTGWYIVGFIPKVIFMYHIIVFTIITILTALGLYIIAIFIGNKVTKEITTPINLFIDKLNEVGEGNYDVTMYYPKWATNEVYTILDAVNEMIQRVKNQTSELNKKNQEISSQHEEINALYEETIAMNDTLNELVDQLSDSYKTTVSCLANAIEANDEYTKGHCERVTKYSLSIANEIGMNSKDLLNLEYAALLHDIGKIGIPSTIVNKPGKLTDEEYEIIKKHPAIGYEIIKEIQYLKESAAILYQHHERIDGKGYPNGLNGNKLNLMSKILAVADSYDAMTSKRPYKSKPLTKEEAIVQMMQNKNSQFDSEIVDVFVELLKRNII